MQMPLARVATVTPHTRGSAERDVANGVSLQSSFRCGFNRNDHVRDCMFLATVERLANVRNRLQPQFTICSQRKIDRSSWSITKKRMVNNKQQRGCARLRSPRHKNGAISVRSTVAMSTIAGCGIGLRLESTVLDRQAKELSCVRFSL